MSTFNQDLLAALKMLYRSYVNLLEAGRDRIIELGGQCDAVDLMERADQSLINSRESIARAESEQADVRGVPEDVVFRSRTADLLHLLSFAKIETPSVGDAKEAEKAMADIRYRLCNPPAHSAQGVDAPLHRLVSALVLRDFSVPDTDSELVISCANVMIEDGIVIDSLKKKVAAAELCHINTEQLTKIIADKTAEIDAHIGDPWPYWNTKVAQDAKRYRRLALLGCAPMGHPCLDRGTVLRFQTLDAFVDDDIRRHPSRGEFDQMLNGLTEAETSATSSVAWLPKVGGYVPLEQAFENARNLHKPTLKPLSPEKVRELAAEASATGCADELSGDAIDEFARMLTEELMKGGE